MAIWAAAIPAIAAGVSSLAAKSFSGRRKSRAPAPEVLMGANRQGADEQRRVLADLQPKLRDKLNQFRTGAEESFGEYQTKAGEQIDVGKNALSGMRQMQGTQLARTLQERAFKPVRSATEFVRQNLSTTKSGASQEALAAPTMQAQQQYGEALTDLSQQLLQGEINLADQANRQKLELVEQQLGFEQGMLSTVFQFGTQQDKDLARELMDIQSQQTANDLQALSAGQLGQFAARSANTAAAAARDKELYGVGGDLLGSLMGQMFQGSGQQEIQDIGGGRTWNPNIQK